MSKRVSDQADGLRRLLARAPTRVIAVAGMGSSTGTTTATMNLGAALVHQGRDVLLIDESASFGGSACEAWSLDPSGTLADLATGRVDWKQAGSQAACGVHVLPATPGDATALTDPRDFFVGGAILIDAALDANGCLSPLAQRADELVLVVRPTATSITDTYASIKRLHYAHALKQARLLVNGADDIESAQQIVRNLADTCSRYLAVSLQAAGWVRRDAHLADARRLRQTVVEAFPTSPAAIDFRRVADALWLWPWDSRASQAPGAPSAPQAMHHSSMAALAGSRF
jgi:flagellar biosynthesis protein FlhG